MNQKEPELNLSRREMRERAARQESQSSARHTQELKLNETAAIQIDGQQYDLTTAQLEIVQQLEAKLDVEFVVPEVGADGKPLDRRGIRRAKDEAYGKILAEWEAAHGKLGAYDPKKEQQKAAAKAKTAADTKKEVPAEYAPVASEIAEPAPVSESISKTAASTASKPVKATKPAAKSAVSANKDKAVRLDAGLGDPLKNNAATAAGEVRKDAEGYSFPDIAPLDTEQSVFDAPRYNTVDTSVGFDTLISRAVEEETTGSVSIGTAALILPQIPSEAMQQSVLDEERGIFISGSLQLHPSISQTGGYRRTADGLSDDMEIENDSIYQTGNNTQPIAAVRAVSAHRQEGAKMFNEAKKDSSRAPMFFAIGGGVLIVSAVGVVIAAVNGLLG
ncbi:hypothetical protein KJY77_00975 [Canibacter sp. lx-72]|uniref:hypothetical protein n=1 Tax=Canibacter zhuwentaonis TaxID=2837491 RepID=UPI001BDD2138|nr:hypothetical protein [Canibacter zhuwentaonis]MBT1017718.1 hypothetical protein [Canibacter zhuwentaonis]